MKNKIDIHKAGGVLLKDRKFLTTRSKGKDFFIAPGGKVEEGETVEGALTRELNEELGINVREVALKKLGIFFAQAAGQPDKQVKMEVFIVTNWDGDVKPCAEVEELMWIDSSSLPSIKLGSIFEHDVLPWLKDADLID